MACEVIIKLKNDQKSLTKKTMVYENIGADFSDSKIDLLLGLANKEFNDHPKRTDVTIKLFED